MLDSVVTGGQVPWGKSAPVRCHGPSFQALPVKTKQILGTRKVLSTKQHKTKQNITKQNRIFRSRIGPSSFEHLLFYRSDRGSGDGVIRGQRSDRGGGI